MPALIQSEFHFTTEDIGAVVDLDPLSASDNAIDEGLVVNSATGGIEIDTGGSIRGGLTDFDDPNNNGFFSGFDQDTLAHVATIGDPSNEHLTWNGEDLTLDIDGSNLTVNGGTTGQGLVVASDGTVTFVDLVNVLNDLSDVNATPSVGQFLKWSGTEWIASNVTNVIGIDDLTDVVISTIATDDILKYNGTNWVNVAPSDLGNLLVLNDLSNVNATPSVGQFLKWSGTEWSHSNITNILGIGDMTDVNISSATTNDILQWTGTLWVNRAPSTLASSISGSIALDDLSNVLVGVNLANDEILVYDSANVRWKNQSVVTIADTIKLRHLEDVTYIDGSPTLTNGKYLKYNGTTWVASDVSLALNDLSNVSVSSPSTGQFLKWNGTSWSASNVTEVLELNDLSGVTITSVTTDNILKYNGTNWVNAALSLNDISGVNLGTLPPTTPVVTGVAVPVLGYNDSTSEWKATVLEIDDLYGIPAPTVEGSILYVSDETHAEEFLWSTNFKMVGSTSATAFPQATDTFTATSNNFAGPSIVLNNENVSMSGASNYHYGSINFNGNDTGTNASGTRGSIVGDSTGNNGELDLVFSTADINATVEEAMRIDSSGNLLVNGTNPTAKLVVDGDANAYTARFNSSTTAGQAFGTRIRAGTSSSDYALLVENTSAASMLAVRGDGNVGIGTSTPQASIHTTGDAIIGTATHGTSYEGVLQIADGAVNERTVVLIYNNHPDQFMKLGQDVNTAFIGRDQADEFAVGVFDNAADTTLSKQFVIDANGNVLIATTDTFVGDNSTGGGISFASGGAASFARSAGKVMYVNRTGSSPGEAIEFRYNGGDVGNISVTSSATGFNTSSDQRLKDNIVDAPSASDDIDAIQVRSFDWKVDGSHQKYGMVAQELQSVAPEAVSEGETEEEMMGVDYSKLVPMLVKEIQSLRARVAQLEGEN